MSIKLSSVRELLSVLFMVTFTLTPLRLVMANGNPDQPNPLELARLPKYCVAQFYDKSHQMPAYSVKGCGVFMNHFCSGLNFLNRASDSTKPKAIRQWNAARARSGINYTKEHMEAGCAISNDVNAADMRLRAIEIFVK
jgi:hypothetical protein